MVTNYPINSTIDMDLITQALIDIKAESHHNLLEFQRNNTGIDRVDFKIKMFQTKYLAINGKTTPFYGYHLNYDFILTRNHIRYKNSALYDKVLSLNDIDSNRNIFNKIPLVFVNGRIIDFPFFKVVKNELTILFEKADIDMDALNDNTEVTILFIPNNEYNPYHSEYEVVKRHKERLNKYYIEDYKIDTTTKAAYDQSILNCGFYFKAMVRDSNSLFTNGLKYSYDNSTNDNDNKKMYLNLASIRSYIARLKVISSNGHNYVEAPKMKMPVPKENVIPLEMETDGTFTLNSDIEFGESYHGIYEVLNLSNNDAQYIYCLITYNYERDEFADAENYVRHTDLYQKVMNIDASNIDSLANALYRNYNVDAVTYSTSDYFNQNTNDNVSYRINELKKIIEKYPMMYSKYLKLLSDSVDGFYIDLSTIDYESKKRMNSYKEAIEGESITYKQFVDERLVIILKNEERNKTRLRLYVDGVLYMPDFLIQRGIYDIYYIPTAMAKPTSIIEVEKFRFHLDTFDKTMTSIDDVIIIPNLNEGVKDVRDKSRIADIYISVKSTGKYLRSSDFDIYYKNSLVSHESNKLIDGEILIRINNVKYATSTLVVSVGKVAFTKETKVLTETSMDDYVRFKLPMMTNPKFIRFYRNYRLIPPHFYNIQTSETSSDYTYGFSGIKDVVGDVFTVDYTSIKYEEEFTMDNIPSHGIIDLRGKLDRPLSYKWYDFYLNGKRLTPTTAEILSPYLLRVNPSVKTLKNFVIMSRDSDQELISTKDKQTIIESLYDADIEFRRKLQNNIVPNTEEDIITEIVTGIDFDLPKVFMEVLYPINFINPDLQQIDDTMYNRYAKYFEEDKTTIVLGKVINSTDSIFINPDEEKKDYSTVDPNKL